MQLGGCRCSIQAKVQAAKSHHGWDNQTMIVRIWHGWTSHANADAFEAVVRYEMQPLIVARNIYGFRGTQLLRLTRTGQTEFVTISRFEDMEAVRRFAGEDYEAPVLIDKARDLLRRMDQRTQHYEVRAEVAIEPRVD
jgi:heme-degrading monooxygenase HmoA